MNFSFGFNTRIFAEIYFVTSNELILSHKTKQNLTIQTTVFKKKQKQINKPQFLIKSSYTLLSLTRFSQNGCVGPTMGAGTS